MAARFATAVSPAGCANENVWGTFLCDCTICQCIRAGWFKEQAVQIFRFTVAGFPGGLASA